MCFEPVAAAEFVRLPVMPLLASSPCSRPNPSALVSSAHVPSLLCQECGHGLCRECMATYLSFLVGVSAELFSRVSWSSRSRASPSLVVFLAPGDVSKYPLRCCMPDCGHKVPPAVVEGLFSAESR